MSKVYGVEVGWHEVRESRYTGDGAVMERFKAMTKNCPCDICPRRIGCLAECPLFRSWTHTGIDLGRGERK